MVRPESERDFTMGNRLFVGNLPFDTTEKQVRDLIAGNGRTVQSVKIVTDKDTGKSRGFAFVDVEDDAQAQAAIAELNGKDFGGRALVVNEAQDRGHGGGGKFGGGGGFRSTPHGKEDRGARSGGFGMRGPAQNMPRGSQRGGGRGGTRGS
jgi:RNA recognition motif-containing protein